MDVANALHLPPELDYESDVTPEGVEFMRRRSSAKIEGETWVLVDSADARISGLAAGGKEGTE